MLAEEAPVPYAIVNGSDDPLVNVDYVGGLSYRNLWDDHCYLLRGAGHACFLHEPAAFNAILARFATDMAVRGIRKPAGTSRVVAA
jgi:pimeloyl-ACP methyl ester carboxylesterase